MDAAEHRAVCGRVVLGLCRCASSLGWLFTMNESLADVLADIPHMSALRAKGFRKGDLIFRGSAALRLVQTRGFACSPPCGRCARRLERDSS